MNLGKVLAEQDRMTKKEFLNIPKGRKTKDWERIRRSLKKEFFAKGITVCEICGSDFGLSFSHRVKRRFIEDERELRTVVLVCARHHEYLENHPRKVEKHNEIIEARV